MENKFEEFKKLLKELWDDLYNDLISEDEYQEKRDSWLMENGSDELFDQFSDMIENKMAKIEVENLRKKWKSKTLNQ